MPNKGWNSTAGSGPEDWTLGTKTPSDDGDERFSRFRDTDMRHGQNMMPSYFGEAMIRPSNAGQQYRAGGFTRLETPVGGDLPPVDNYPLSGNAGGPREGGDGYNVAAMSTPAG